MKQGISVHYWLTWAQKRLGGDPKMAMLDASLLLEAATGIGRQEQLLYPHQAAPETMTAYQDFVAQRCQGYPLAYLVGYKDFWQARFYVNDHVLIPRPDSELLLELCHQYYPHTHVPLRFLDLGTGSGCLLLSALMDYPTSCGLGIDSSPQALSVAHRNCAAMNLQARADLAVGDWLQGVQGNFDAVFFNPPYLDPADEAIDASTSAYEPATALFAPNGGLQAYELVLPQLPAILTKNGYAFIEIGYQQRQPVQALLDKIGAFYALYQDLGGHDRALVAWFFKK